MQFRIDAKARPWPMLLSWNGEGEPDFKPIAEAEDVSDVRRMAIVASSHAVFLKQWKEREIFVEEECREPGFWLRARKYPKSDLLEVELVDPSGTSIGSHNSYLSSWEVEYVIGRRTLNGSSFLDSLECGKGLGRQMYDFVEKASELQLTPHGRFCAPGSLSTAARLFWEKRFKIRGIPWEGDPETARRNSVMETSRDAMRIVHLDLSRPENMIALAEILEGEVAIRSGYPRSAACRLPDGRILDPANAFEDGVEPTFVSTAEAWKTEDEIAAIGWFPFPFGADKSRARKDVALYCERFDPLPSDLPSNKILSRQADIHQVSGGNFL